MRTRTSFGFIARTLMALGVLGLAVTAMTAPGYLAHQRRGGGGGGGGQRSAPQRQAPQRQAQAPAHARRETVRTKNFVPPNGGQAPDRSAPQPRQDTPIQQVPREQARRPGVQNNPRVQSQRTFTKTPQGRRYDNGLQLRRGVKVTAAWQRHYFPHGTFHFPFYRQSYVRGACFISPFGFYFGICCPFIDISVCSVLPPAVAYIDVPIYNGNTCIGYPAFDDVNYLNVPDLNDREPGLQNAVDELTETFQSGNIDALVSLIDPNVSIAVYERGKYKYSLASNNWVDLTRDALQNLHTNQFSISRLRQRAPGIFVASGTHNYTDSTGRSRTVYVSFSFQDFGGQWTLTQVGTAPDVAQSWKVVE